ncbi:DUF106 domain-containing protein [Halovenus rubra]|uniref:DUF106 domain-containing protein n=2 Tax=Halovenus rubra TaxID=869890 RepID=A0ACC7DX83_9EURY|nr:DUF106 domain-containing protein [Halovenus rubra]
MSVEQLEILLSDPATQEAVAVVFERSEGGSKEVNWSDVSDELTDSQWGKLLEKEVLVGAGTGFALAEPERVYEQLTDADEIDDRDLSAFEPAPGPSDESDLLDDFELPEVEPVEWSTWDKAAGGFALLLFTGYWSTSIRDAIASVENVVVDSALGAVPFYLVVLLLATVTGFYSTWLQRRLVDQDKLQQYRDRMEKLSEYRQMAKESDDEEAIKQLQEKQREAAGSQIGMMKLQFRSTVWIMLLTIPIFLWLRWKVRGGHLGADKGELILPLAGDVTWTQSLAGPMATWIVWYFVCSMASRQIIQKLSEFWFERSG